METPQFMKYIWMRLYLELTVYSNTRMVRDSLAMYNDRYKFNPSDDEFKGCIHADDTLHPSSL